MSEKITTMTAAETDQGYYAVERLIAERVAAIRGPVFQMAVTGEELWSAYLTKLPAESRQHYNCHACRRFIERYGGLVTIDEKGMARSALWEADRAVPEFFRRSFYGMQRVAVTRITGQFLSSEATWGTPVTAILNKVSWTHLSGKNPAPFVGKLLTAEQLMAERREDHGMLCRALADYPIEVVEQARRLLAADAVYRSEKAQGVADWFLKLHQQTKDAPRQQRDGLIWLAVATAPPGFCHVRSTVISTLLDDIVEGRPVEAIQRRWAEKLHPLQYQRPSAAPSEGAIEAAERLVEKLGVANSLKRRFARLDEVLTSWWEPAPKTPREELRRGVFSHLKVEMPGKPLELPSVTVTWDKFQRTVLPLARQMDLLVPDYGNFYGLVTAVDPEAPPILQWDGLVAKGVDFFHGHHEIPLPRNPVSWYMYQTGSYATTWHLTPGWVRVKLIFPSPAQWQWPDQFTHHGEAVQFALDGCWDGSKGTGLGLFPEILRAEFHGIRSVIEAHSRRSGQPDGAEQGDANGIAFQRGNIAPWGQVELRVVTAEGPARYRIDRWD